MADAELLAHIKTLEEALKSAAAWIKHWQADVECNLKPTPGSLAEAAADIRVALAVLKSEAL